MDTDTGIKGMEEIIDFCYLSDNKIITIEGDVITIPADKGIEDRPFIKLAKKEGFVIQYKLF